MIYKKFGVVEKQFFGTILIFWGSYIHISFDGIAHENSQADINAQFASTSGKLIVEYGLSVNDIDDQYSYGKILIDICNIKKNNKIVLCQ